MKKSGNCHESNEILKKEDRKNDWFRVCDRDWVGIKNVYPKRLVLLFLNRAHGNGCIWIGILSFVFF